MTKSWIFVNFCQKFSEGEAVSIFEDFSSNDVDAVWDHMRDNHGLDYHVPFNMLKTKQFKLVNTIKIF